MLSVLLYVRWEICVNYWSFLQAENAVIRTWGEKRTEGKLKIHVDLVKLLDIVDLDKGILLHYYSRRHEY